MIGVLCSDVSVSYVVVTVRTTGTWRHVTSRYCMLHTAKLMTTSA